jgi:potassium efflux system protein
MDFQRHLRNAFRYLPALLTLTGLLVGLPPATLPAEDPGAVTPGLPTPPSKFEDFLENALNTERSNLVEIEEGLKRWEALKVDVNKEIESYRLQNAAYNNLLLVSQTRIDDLQTALNSNRLLIKSLSERITEFGKIGIIAGDRMKQLAERIAVAEKQLSDLPQETLPESERKATRSQLDKLLELLREKKKRGEAFLQSYTTLFDQLKQMMGDLQETRQRLEERLQMQVKTNLYERTPWPVRLGNADLLAELGVIRKRAASSLSTDFWHQQWINYQRSGGVTQAVFFLLMVSAVLFRRKVRGYFKSVETRQSTPSWQQRRLALLLLRRSFVLLCAAALLWLYDLLKLPHMDIRIARFLTDLVFVLLLVRWGTDFLNHGLNDSGRALQAYTQKRLLHALQMLLLSAIGFLLLIWLAGSESLLLLMARMAFEIVLLVWVVRFWRHWQPAAAQGVRLGEPAPAGTRVLLVQGWSYVVAGGALLMELTGYGELAGHWLVSWTKTLMLGIWAYVGWQAIQEWYADQRAAAKGREDGVSAPVMAPVGWFMIQMARLLWLFALLSGGLLVWSSKDFTTTTLTWFFNLAFAVGSLTFSIKGLLLAVIIICLTQVATRLGQNVLREKILDSRDLERGLRDSIVTITTYVVWSLGLLLTLGVLGVNATSLAVVAGALSIGIGFGLQNIFNNFISGLILLFERPIQVGDYVEVNGLWAEVKQINVRATIVQTFDNASVIIPNSDFISQQVTNWSFKDPRMRRQVDVGVAYGSDIELVRKTLLEIAAQTPQILKYPRPDVLFMDHADSALLFRLRFWTHVDNYWSTTTDVRFELDRRFRELGIEIAFPQRDLHIRSVDPGIFSRASATACPASSSESPSPPASGDAEA